nr:unnamed protein product [Callosobruchus analis]
MDTHPDIAGNHVFRCIYCKNTLTCKKVLDDHIVKKHPDFIASISSKVHECTKCSFKTVHPSRLKKHIKVKHPDIDGNHITNRCIYCNKTFTSKQALDGHIIKTHPDFIASVTSKVHECTECTYKTTITKNETQRKGKQVVADKKTDGDMFVCYHCECAARSKYHLIDHMSEHTDSKNIYRSVSASYLKKHITINHPDIAGNRCSCCNKIFVRKQTLDDHIVKTHPDFIASVSRKIHGCTQCAYKTVSKPSLDDHIVKRHPDFIASVSRKIHECTNCTFKTVRLSRLKEHIKVKHPDTASDRIINNCIYCNKTFVHKRTLNDHIVKTHPDFAASVNRKIFECTECTYKTVSTNDLKRHMMVKHPDIAGGRITVRCSYCNKTFISKSSLDDHILKTHPDFIASVSRKVHECTECTYKTVFTSQLRRHMVKHPDIAGNYTTIRCSYCNKTFESKRSLDNHIVKRHPDFVASVSSKIHGCTQCTYRTTISSHLKRHMVKHSDIAGDHITNRCTHCNKTFTSTQALDDHIVKRHPYFIASVSRKVHECTECTYKTVLSSQLRRHMAKHPDIAGDHITNRCTHCNKTFTSTQALDDHIVKRHPDFIASVSRKVHECTECTYKTVFSSQLRRHMAKHPNIADDRITNRCSCCNKTFVRKETLDDHIVKMHPDFIAYVSRKVHECTQCIYKTTSNSYLKRHMVKHSDIAVNRISIRCIYCDKTLTSKPSLDDHIVKRHPDFIASVGRKVHECTKCTFKTVFTSQLRNHMVKHPDIGSNRITNKCIHCNKTFTSKQAVDDHIIKTHPDFTASVSSKVHECTECTYKTTSNSHLKRHMAKHTDIAGI